MKNIKAVIFDLDGTLVHTMPEHRNIIINKTLNNLNKPDAKQEHIERLWFGIDRMKTVEECFDIHPVVFWKEYRKHDTPEIRMNYTKPYNDVNVIQELKNKGIKIGIVTGATPAITETQLSMIGRNLFDSVIIANSMGNCRHKPHPEGLHQCLKELNIEKHEAVFIGNSDEDILAAKNAGMHSIFIDRKEYPINETPDTIINSLNELKNLLEKTS